MTAEAERSAEPAPPASLTARVLSGAVWAAAGYGVQQVVRLGSNLVLARLLAPEAFGVMALVNSFRVGMELVSDIGVAPSVVRSPRGAEPAFLATAFRIQALRGAALWLVAVLAAPFVARFYGEPQLSSVLPVTALVLLLAGLNSPGLLLWRRNLEQRRVQAVELTAQVSAFAVALVWVAIDPTVWGLVASGLAAAAVRLALGHAWTGWRGAGSGWDRSAAREILSFGGWVFVSTLLTFLADEADRLLVGKLVPLATLGVLSIAVMFATLPTTLVSTLGDWVVMPAFSRTLDLQADGVRRTFARVRRPLVAAGGMFVAAGFAAAPAGIELLYDDRYLDAGWMIQVLVVGAWFRVLATPHIAALIALGSMRAVAAGNAAKFLGIALGVPLGFGAAGLPGALVGLASADALRFALVSLASRGAGARSHGADALDTAWVAAAGGVAWLAGGQLEHHSVVRALLGGGAALLLWSPQLWRAARGESWLAARSA